MENLVRTHRFQSIIAERKSALRQSLAQIFPQPGKFVCELGCGHGHFLVAYALAHPTALCIGLDIENDRIERAKRKQERAKAALLHFLQADANLFVENLPTGVIFSEVFILFPDPWPKKRHHKHRLIQSAFLDKIRRHSANTSRIYFRTDYEPYFEEARSRFDQHPAWQLVDEPWPFEHETVFQSRAASHRSLVAQPRPLEP